MIRLTYWPLVLLLFFAPSLGFSANKVIFDGYYKVTLMNKHIGYFIQRYEIDQKKKQFVSISFIRTNVQGANISESLRATATETFQPLEYLFTNLAGKQWKTIDAKVKGDGMTVKIVQNNQPSTQARKLKKGTFFSTFLTYLMMQEHQGIKTGIKYDYNAVAEEDGKVFTGTAYVEKEEQYKGLSTYKILNTFKGDQFVVQVNKKGEVLRVYSPSKGLGVEIVAQPQQATQGFAVDASSLKLLFGNVPSGQENEFYKTNNKTAVAPTPKTTPTKKSDHKKTEKGK